MIHGLLIAPRYLRGLAVVKRADHLEMKRQLGGRLAGAQRELAEARALIRRLREPPMVRPKAPPPPPYEIRVPVANNLWVSLRATRPLESKHWDRLYALLDLQREIAFSPAFVPLIEEDIGAPMPDPSPTRHDDAGVGR